MPKTFRTGLLAAGAIACLTILAFIRLPDTKSHSPYAEKLAPYQVTFADFDVVWAEARSGTVEYATRKAGFRFNWGPQETRQRIIAWLRDNGYRQAIWIDDHHMEPRESIEKLLQEASIKYHEAASETLGAFLVVPPQSLSDTQ